MNPVPHTPDADAIDALIDAMSFTEKVGQLNQRLLGWKSLTRDGSGRLAVTDELKREIDRWGGLGVLYGLFRADPWSGRHWGNGVRPEERPEAIRLVQEAVLSRGAHGIGALLTLVSLCMMRPYFRAFTGNEEIYRLSIAYMGVCSFMQIPNMVHIAIQKMIQATGNMVTPMWFQIAGVVVNFVLNPVLIFGIGVFPAMGIVGSASATVSGYLVSMILAFALLLGTKQKVQVKVRGFRLQRRMIGRIFVFGLPSFIMNALSSFMVTIVNLFLVAYSDTAIAFFGAYFKVQQLIVMTVNGLIQGCLPVMRFNYAAGNKERLHLAFRYGTVLVTGMMVLGTLVVVLLPAQILGLFMASEAMRSFGISAMRIMAASYLFCGLSTMISTYFQATEKVYSSIAIQLCRQLLFLVPALWCLDKLFRLNGIWLAFPVAEIAALLVALVMMAWYRRKEGSTPRVADGNDGQTSRR